MFDVLKITTKCKSFLKKHNIPFCEDVNIYRKLGLIHCKVQDWRGSTELNGFPTFSSDEACFILIDYCLAEFYILEERDNRDELIKQYPKSYGKYDSRKYAFERIIEAFKDYSNSFYLRSIKKYTKYINTNSNAKLKWVYDRKQKCFTTLNCIDLMAIKVSKKFKSVLIYNMDPQQGRLGDNIYRYIITIKEKDYIKFVFTNNGNDRYFLYVYNFEACEENDDYILIGMADKIIWDYPSFENKSLSRKNYTYLYIDGEINIKSKLLWKGSLEKKYNSQLFFSNIKNVISSDNEPKIELYDKYANRYYVIAYKDFCDFYDADGIYHRLNSIEDIEQYLKISDVVDIHNY